MSAVPEPSPEFNEIVDGQYRESTLNLYGRWLFYDYAAEPVNHYDLAYQELGLEPDAAILDVGCSDGRNFRRFRKEHGHRGQLIGMDIQSDLFTLNREAIRKMGGKMLDLCVGSAQRLPFADDSVDASLAMFVLYHVNDIGLALDELKRVTKPDGQVVIATSGKNNKWRHRQIERAMADELGISPPPRFSERFDADVAADMLPEWFDDVHDEPQVCEAHIPREGVEDYLMSLLAMRPSFGSYIPPRAWMEACRVLVRPVLEYEIDTNGYFVDYVDRHFYICQNSKD